MAHEQRRGMKSKLKGSKIYIMPLLFSRSWRKMDTNIITYLACICFLFLFGRIFILPIKKILKLVFNSILGGITIFVINIVGGSFGFHIGLNIFTSILIRITRTSWGSMLDNYKMSCWGRCLIGQL